MRLSPLSIAVQGVCGPLQAIALASQGIIGAEALALPGGSTKRRRIIHLPGYTVNIPAPPDPRRPRKRRDADLLLLGQ